MIETFIRRPILSLVISILITLLGLLALFTLPVTQFPDIVPPSVTVTAKYTGANAEVCAKAVATPLERAINGVPGMTYMSSVSSNNGITLIQVFFKVGTDPDQAAVNVQNRVTTVLDELPEEVIKAGVTTEKEVNSMLLYLNVMSTDSAADEEFIYNFADINILQELKRIDGVGFAEIMGAREYSMRVWLKPDRMLAYNISADEVIQALRNQNVEAAPGKTGESSGKTEQPLQYVLRYTGKFFEPNQYREVILKASEDGTVLKLKDIADVEFGTLSYGMVSKTDGKPSASIMIKQRPGSNAKEVIENIKEKMAELKKTSFPPGMKYNFAYDVSRFLDASMHEVVRTLIEAFLLVFVVVFIFLQDFRSILIPALAVPVALIGTLAFMQLLGFSINLLTLFALVLAIGIVVDDAIVVVEAVHAKLDHGYDSPKEATVDAMGDITSAIISITLVMAAVFIPVSFISGSAGVFFKQFGLTLAIAIILSAINALTLSPTLCALFLKPHHENKLRNKGFFQRFHSGFNAAFDVTTAKYRRSIHFLAHRKWIGLVGIAVFAGLFFFLFKTTPKAFVPDEDMGIVIADISLPASASSERTDKAIRDVEKIVHTLPEVESVFHVNGFGIFSGAGSSYGVLFIKLQPWDKRKGKDQDVKSLINKLFGMTGDVKEARVTFFAPPTLQGFGFGGGIEFQLQDKSGGDIARFSQISDNFLAALNKRPEIQFASTAFNINFPQYEINVDVARAKQAGLSVNDILSTMQGYYGGVYASNFNQFGKQYRVLYQAEPEFRTNPESLNRIYVRNAAGTMAPITGFITVQKVYGPQTITRFNMYTSISVNGSPKPGFSSGDAIKAVSEVASQVLPPGYGYEFSGVSREEIAAGNQTGFIFLLVIVFVYFLLCAQYESYILPFAVLLSLPMGLAGAFLFTETMGISNNIYVQITMIMLVGLLAKNAILIVEFAVNRRRRGMSITEAALEGAVVRLRPILMTSFAFIFGLLPLMFTRGAGANGNRSIGTGAVGGMLIGTLFGVFVIPTLFIIFQSLHERIVGVKKRAKDADDIAEAQS